MGGSHNLLKSLGLVKVNKSPDDTPKKLKKAKGRKWKFWKSSVHAANDKQEVVVRKPNFPRGSEDWAAVVIQTSFRCFKARRALRAIKGVVRLQALVRGRTVRKQASITLRCMQTLVKVQRARQTRLSEASAMRAIAQRQIPPDRALDSEKKWSDSVRTKEEMRNRIQQKHEAAIKRERALAYAFSHQWRAHPRPPNKGSSDNPEWEWGWLERWMASRPWENHAVEEALKNGHSNSNTKNAAQLAGKDGPGDGFDSPRSEQSNGMKTQFHPTPGSDKSSPRSTKASSKANGIDKPVVKSRYMDHFNAPKQASENSATRSNSTPKQRPIKEQVQDEESIKKKRLSLPAPPKSPLITTPKKKA